MNTQGMVGKKEKPAGYPYWRVIAVVYAAALFALNFVRIFDNNFWGDEGYTIRLSMMSVPEMIEATALDVHPPLYYLVVQAVCKIFGFNGPSYHLASILPYGLILIFALTAVWKSFGKEASFLLITFASIMRTAVQYNVEARMYSLGALFVLLSFYGLYLVLMKNRCRDYVFFVLMSLAAAYTHYYSLITVAFFYIVLFFFSCVRRREYLKKTLWSCILTVLAYLPWFFILLGSFKRTSDTYWMKSIPSIEECFRFIFSSDYMEWVFIFVFVLCVIGYLFYSLRKIRANKSTELTADMDFKELLFMAAGLLSIIGTMAVGILVSMIIRPMFIVRYLFPAALVAWFMIAIVVSKLKKKTVVCCILTAFTLLVCVPQYVDTYTKDRKDDRCLQDTLALTKSEIGVEDTIYTTQYHLDWTVLDYYYPGTHHKFMKNGGFPILKGEKPYWLILGSKMSPIFSHFIAIQDYKYEPVVEKGSLGTGTVYIYKLLPKKGH